MKLRNVWTAVVLLIMMSTSFSFLYSVGSENAVYTDVTSDARSDIQLSDTGQTVWNKTYGTADGERPLEIIKAQSGGYYILYLDQDTSSGDSNASLMRIDLEGNHLWNRTIHKTALQTMPSLTQTQDGGFTIMCSYINITTSNVSIFLVHLDSEGDQVWNNTLNLEIADYGVQLIESTGGDYYLVCYNWHKHSDDSWAIVSMLVRTDDTGNLIWKKVYTPGWQTTGVNLVESGAGDIVVLSETRNASNYDFWIYSVDSNGNHNWNYTFDLREHDRPYDIEMSTTGGYVIGGQSAEGSSIDAVLLHLNGSGSHTWNNTYSFEQYSTLSDLIVSADGSIKFLGTAITAGLDYTALIVHLNAAGQVLWNDTFGNSEVYQGLSLIEVSPDIYIVAASVTDSQPIYPPYDMWIAKVEAPIYGLVSANQVLEVSTWFNYDLDAASGLGIDTWWLNDTTNFMIDADGLIQNASVLAGGIYGLEVSVNDTGGRSLSTTFSVMVTDTQSPTWRIPLSDQFAEYGVQFLYPVEAVDVSGISVYWLDNPHFTIDPSGVILNATSLSLGDYSVTISVNDTVGNTLSVEITIRVRDTTSPLPDDLLYLDYEVGESGFWLNWSCIELLPESYELLLDGAILTAGSWTGFDITYFVEGHELGTYNYTVLFVDTSGNSASGTVIVQVEDTTSPTVNQPLDIWYLEGVGGGIIEWHPEDVQPHTYIIYLDGAQVQTGGWSETSIMIHVDNLMPGIHNYTIVIFDISGNYVLDTVLVTVQAISTTTTVTTPITTTNQTNLQQTIDNLYDQISILTISLAIVGTISVVSIVFVIFSLKKLRE